VVVRYLGLVLSLSIPLLAQQADRAKTEALARRASDRLQTLLRETFTPDELERLLAEGATMSEEEAVRLALED